uniref:Cyclin I n=1 Tax=Gadus morhua TaxID=8049 RepID=A0A8C5CGY3_GADMO
MKFTEPWERQRLCSLLENAVSREAMMWKAYVPKKPSPQDTDISPAQRDEAVRWLAEVHGSLQLYPETLALAVSILDRFLGPIKLVPPLSVLAGSSGCDCTVSEIRRMERVILDKLHWNLHTATPLHFLQIFHALLVCGGSMVLVGGSRSQHLSLLTRRLHHCLADHTLTQVRGSMLALSLISLELESCCSDWLILTIDLLSKAKMDSRELIRCREQLSRRLSTQRASLPPNTLYIYHPRQDPPRRAPPPPAPGSTLSTVEVMEVDDFFDGIKRLYNEESEPPAGSVSPCPPLQPIPAP